MSIKKQLQPFLNKFRYKHNKGYCLICEQPTEFYEYNTWLRDHYKCIKCQSIPRNRALVHALDVFYPEWKGMNIHESSPGGPLSDFLKRTAKQYSASHYYEDVKRGEYRDGFRSEDLSALTFPDNSFDLFITSDVFEHVFEPALAFKEIARVLKPGGAHVFTMPWTKSLNKSVKRAELQNGKIVHLLKPEYHGNPISADGSLVTYDWGTDFCSIIYEASRLYTTIYLEKNRELGLEADYLEVFISKKEQPTIS